MVSVAVIFCSSVEAKYARSDDIPLPRFACSFLVTPFLRYASAKDCGERWGFSQTMLFVDFVKGERSECYLPLTTQW